MARWVWLSVALGAGVLVAVLLAERLPWKPAAHAPSARLLQHERVLALAPPPPGAEWDGAEDHPALLEAVNGTDPDRLRSALSEAGLAGLWTEVRPKGRWEPELPLAERFAAGGVVRGFRGEILTAGGLLYVPDRTQVPVVLAQRVLARAARAILEGNALPVLADFPQALVTLQAVEVLVMLTGAQGPRLWRSAKADSIAQGLITASVAARKRWEERSDTMGGSLGERLDGLDVEVALLIDDGTLDPSAVSLIDELVKPVHGVAYEQPARWRYLLPRATFAAGSPTEAFRTLFRDNGLSEDSFDRADIRLYRILMHTLSVDQGSAGSSRDTELSGSGD